MKVKSLLLLVFALVLIASNSFAFCIYNHTNLWLMVTVSKCATKFLGFNEKFCADWKDKKCNHGGKEDSPIHIMVCYRDFNYGSEVHWSPLFVNIEIKANQDLEIYYTSQTGQLHKDYHWRIF